MILYGAKRPRHSLNRASIKKTLESLLDQASKKLDRV